MANNLLSVGVVFGGLSEEHEVSIKSAFTIINALRDKNNQRKFKVIPIYINKQGYWSSGIQAEKVLTQRSKLEQDELKTSIELKKFTNLPKEIDTIDIWFPVLHGPNGEDGTIQGFFKLTGKPFIGSGVLGSALGMDKIAMKSAFSASSLPQVKYCTAFANEIYNQIKLKALLKNIESQLGYPCFIKPANLGSSVGITKAYNKNDLLTGLNLAAKLDKRIVIEKGIKARELECAVLGKSEELTASCVGEVRYSSDWYDYQTKYSNSTNKVLIPAPIPEEITKKVQALSIIACKAIAVEGFARVDFFYEEAKENLWINEINTIPGFTTQSMYPMLWDASGINLSQLVARLVESA